MRLEKFRRIVSRRPGMIIAVWFLIAAVIGLTSPSLTRLAAEGQANLLPKKAESARMQRLVSRIWPDQVPDSMAVVALERDGKLAPDDERFARRLAEAFQKPGRPKEILRVLGPQSEPEVAERLVSRDGTMRLVAVYLTGSFVTPAVHRAVAWLEAQAASLDRERPAGLKESWTGDAVVGRDYMADVQKSLNRAAIATVALLLIVLLVVYRSVLVALIPLITIAVSLVIARGVLAWLTVAGWDVSPLVELFLVVVLFGSGTDFCLFLAWRFCEHWDASDPARAMEVTLRHSMAALLTSAGTVIAGLSLMGTTKFKLFSSTGPSVALGLAITVVAALTLTPALLVFLARLRPKSFTGLTCLSCGFWDKLATAVLKRPFLTWLATLAVMVPPAVLGLQADFIQDTLSEMPPQTRSVVALRHVAAKFGQGFLAPLAIVLESHSPKDDFRQSEGLALLDETSRFLSQHRKLDEVRSATQPLGSTALLDPARIGARLGEVNKGFGRMAEGAQQLHNGLQRGVQQIRLSEMLESAVKGNWKRFGSGSGQSPERPTGPTAAHRLVSTVSRTNETLDEVNEHVDGAANNAAAAVTTPATSEQPADPREKMTHELTRAAEGAGQIAEGARRAGQEVSEILEDPVGRKTLDRLLITPRTVREHPDLLRSFKAYISPDGRLARIDVIQDERISSEAAMNQVVQLRRQLNEFLGESHWFDVSAGFAGSNAEATDIRALTRRDQYWTWIIVPAGVFLILMITLRDPWACMNLVATMILTYCFALGITHAVFVTFLGHEGIDWKVPYFLFVLLVAVGVDYNVFLMARLHEEARSHGLFEGIRRAVAATGGLITSAAAITTCSFASLLLSPLGSLRQLGFALVVGVTVDAVLVRPVLVPCGHWLMKRRIEKNPTSIISPNPEAAVAQPAALAQPAT